MSIQQQTAKQFAVIGRPSRSMSGAGDAGSRLKRRIEIRNEDYAYQVEAERRDLATVAVLGYN